MLRFSKENEYPTPYTMKNRFGSWCNALKEAGIDVSDKVKEYRRYGKERMLRAIKKASEFSEGELKMKDYDKVREKYPDMPSSSGIRKAFDNSWNKALEEAGIPQSRIPKDYDNSSELLKEYREDIEEYLSEETVRNRIQVLYDIDSYLDSLGKKWSDLDFSLVKDYFDILKTKGIFNSHFKAKVKLNSPRTLKMKYRILAVFLKWIIKRAEIKDEPSLIPRYIIMEIIAKTKRPRIIGREQRATKRRALTEEQIEKIRDVINNPVISNIFDIGLNLGLRRIEYERVKLDHLHLDENYMDIIGKGEKLRDVALTIEMKELILYQISLRNLNKVEHEFFFFHPRTKGLLRKSALNMIYRELAKKTAIKFNAHELRYTMDAIMLERGVTINILAQRMGHSPSLTFHYSREPLETRVKVLQAKVGIL